jgi:hypothetical protein
VIAALERRKPSILTFLVAELARELVWEATMWPRELRIPLPDDPDLLRDVYVEASRYVEFGDEFARIYRELKVLREAHDRVDQPGACPGQASRLRDLREKFDWTIPPSLDLVHRHVQVSLAEACAFGDLILRTTLGPEPHGADAGLADEVRALAVEWLTAHARNVHGQAYEKLRTGASRAERAAPRIEVDSDKRIVFLNGNPVPLKNDTGAAFVAAIVGKQGHFVSFREMQESHPVLSGGNRTRIYDGLPAEVRAQIERGPGKGYRLKPQS